MSNTDTSGKLPHWDLECIYPALESESFEQDFRELAARFGIDLRQAGFWQAGLDVNEKRIRRFQELCMAQDEQ